MEQLTAEERARFTLHKCPCCGIDVYNYYDKRAKCRTCKVAAWEGTECPPAPRTGHPFVMPDWVGADAT